MIKKKNTVAQISKRAKQIRKKGEKWTNAIKRASKELKSKKNTLGTTSKTPSYTISGLGGLKESTNATPIPEINITFSRKRKVNGKIGSAKDVATTVSKFYTKNTIEVREQFFVLYLDNSNKVLGYHTHSVGGIKGSVVDIRILFSVALKSLATSIIIAHNHPSGTLKPSTSDIRINSKIKQAGELLDIQLLDHIILTKESFYSFAEEGKL
ncbi:DNA repair protein [Aquimarina sp. BL5]|uniref:JAB domain-containing protein n=1 Tax=Aquimarina sp. BL5 TaxID=1714860 RepID=UPI000E4D7847|nr:JAB domain-containing protein [Aquimarina sp. BL5]AXT51349.1 DNA repair protein [Aquimarina sp. BL5]RKN09861.1 DNA repair protein [Aquimarina sp. BL5]